MHIRALTQKKPEQAFNIELILDIVLQLLSALEALERFLGVDFIDKTP